MAIHRHHHTPRLQVQLLAHGFNDAQIRLMRHQPINIGMRQLIGRQRLIHHRRKFGHSVAKNFLASHAQHARAAGGTSAAFNRQNIPMPAIGMQMG